ncbi:MAG: hypothetical protein LQ350_007495 [Teloschistes chrysophthalmus]|nr:MAG: hypothetical protein LQ350_007495 [Niorma chrysophthalma]
MLLSGDWRSLRQFFPCCLSIIILGILLASANASDINEKSQSDVNKRRIRHGRVEITRDSCPGQDFIKVRNGLNEAFYLAEAGRQAASHFMEPPFSYFFQSNGETATAVGSVYTRVQKALIGQGGRVRITCIDHYHACEEPGGRHRLAYTMAYANKRLKPRILMCPAGLLLPRLAQPCTELPGDRPFTMGSLMLHELIQVKSIAGERPVVEGSSTTAREVNDEVKASRDTTVNALAYSLLGLWAADLGLGGPPQRPCSEKFSDGNFNGSIH